MECSLVISNCLEEISSLSQSIVLPFSLRTVSASSFCPCCCWVYLFVTPDSPGKNTGERCLSFSRGSSQPRGWTWISCIPGWFFTAEPPGKPSVCSYSIVTYRLKMLILSLLLLMIFNFPLSSFKMFIWLIFINYNSLKILFSWTLSNFLCLLHWMYCSLLFKSPYWFVCWWASRLLPCPDYYKQCCDEHWGAHVSFSSGFLSVYAQEWDCWIIWQFYFQFF